MKNISIIKTRQFILRPFRKGDIESLVRHINDRKIARILSFLPYPYTVSDGLEFYRKIHNAARRKKRTRMSFAIEVDGEFVGDISIFRIDGHKAEIGYWLGRKYWGRGFMTEAVKEITKHGFNKLGLRRMYACVFPHNKASMRVLEKAGYKFEGILRKNVKKKNRLIDEYLFAKVR